MDLTNRHLYELSSKGFVREYDLIPNTVDLSNLDTIMDHINGPRKPAYRSWDQDLEIGSYYLRPEARFVLKVYIRRVIYIEANDHMQRSWRDDDCWLYIRKIMPDTADWRKIQAKYEHLLIGSNITIPKGS